MQRFGVKVHRESVLDVWVLQRDIGEDEPLSEDVVDMAFIPNILEGKVFCK